MVTGRLRIGGGLLLCGALGVLVSASSPAQAQGRRVMVMDNGDGARVMHFSMPDLAALRAPEYLRRDLPTFEEKLRLDETQRVIVRLLLDGYLNTFKTLVEEGLPAATFEQGPVQIMRGGPGGAMGGGPIGEIIRGAMGGEPGEVDVDFVPGSVAVRVGAGGGEVPLPEFAGEGGAVAIAVTVGGEEGEEGGAGDGGPGVMVAVAGPDDVELPEEVMAELEERAREMAERLREMLEEGTVDVESPMPLPGFDEDAMAARQARMREMAEKAKVFERARRELGRQFVSDVQSQLDLEQIDLWPDLERTLTREKTLPKGRLDGEREDLLHIFADLSPSDEEFAAVAEHLEAYELALHEALVRRNEYLVDANDKIDKAIAERKVDRALSAVDRATDLRIAVRETNRRFTDLIAATLGEARGAAFRTAMHERAFPRVYRTTGAERAFAAARAVDGVDDDTLAVIDELEEAYGLERAQTDDRIMRAILKHQPDEPRRGIERMRAIMEGEGGSLEFGHGDDDPVHEAFAKRRDLDERYMSRLYGMFSEEQVESLPKLPSQKKRQAVWQLGGEGN